MLLQELVILRYITVIEVGYPEVKDDIQQEGQVEKGYIQSEFAGTHQNLHIPVDPENPERLDQQVKEDDQNQVGYELLFYYRLVFHFPSQTGA